MFVPQFLFASLNLGCGLAQVSHDVNHGFAARAQTQRVLVRVLQEVQQGAPRIVEPLGLSGQPAAVQLVVGQDVNHGLPLVGESLVELVQVSDDVQHRTAPLVAFSQAALQGHHFGLQSAFGGRG